MILRSIHLVCDSNVSISLNGHYFFSHSLSYMTQWCKLKHVRSIRKTWSNVTLVRLLLFRVSLPLTLMNSSVDVFISVSDEISMEHIKLCKLFHIFDELFDWFTLIYCDMIIALSDTFFDILLANSKLNKFTIWLQILVR